ncbi:Homeodomain-like protein [Parasitella parasitica]|nr:Homeodomain-like protein [Parasitella parasitica]
MSNSNLDNYTVFKQDGSQQFYCRWSTEEDILLSTAVANHGPHKWTLVSKLIPGRTAVQCSTRWFGALNPNILKGKWSKHEDLALTQAVRYFQAIMSNIPWNRVAENIPHRTGIQCQARWTEALDPAVRKGRWHPEEDRQLSAAIVKYGCCWIRVASMIPTRTQRQCRTRWNQIHSQHLKAASTATRNDPQAAVKKPFNFNFVPSMTTNGQQPLANKDPFIVISSSPTVDDIIASSNTCQFPSNASISSSSSSFSCVSDSSPTSIIFPISPSTSSSNLLHHEAQLFPAMKSSKDSLESPTEFTDNLEFEFLLDCYTTQQ